MRLYQFSLESSSPYTSSRKHNVPALDGELADAHEERTWRNKLTTNKDDQVIIPAMAFKFALCAAAKFRGEKIKGKGNKTWVKRFESGILITDHVLAMVNGKPVRKEDVQGITVHVNSDGVRGSGKRVFKTFPILPEWSGNLTVYQLDDMITEEVLQDYMETAGKFIGVGQFRAERGGTNGRFAVKSMTLMKDA